MIILKSFLSRISNPIGRGPCEKGLLHVDSQGPRQVKALTFSASSFRAAPNVEVQSAEREREREKEAFYGSGLETPGINSIHIPFAGYPLCDWEGVSGRKEKGLDEGLGTLCFRLEPPI